MNEIDTSPALCLAELKNQNGIRVARLPSVGSPRLDDQTTRHDEQRAPRELASKGGEGGTGLLTDLGRGARERRVLLGIEEFVKQLARDGAQCDRLLNGARQSANQANGFSSALGP